MPRARTGASRISGLRRRPHAAGRAAAAAVTVLAVAGCGSGSPPPAGVRRAVRLRVCRPRSTTAPSWRGCPSMSRPRREPTRQTRTRRSASWACRPPRSTRSPSSGRAAAHHAAASSAYSQGDGASFVPDAPFTPGEQVLVRAVIGARRGQADRRSAFASTRRSRQRASAVSQPAGAARRLPELRHAARRPGPDPDRHRAGPRSRGRRRLHDQRARAGPLRAADLHAAGPARLVRPARRAASPPRI